MELIFIALHILTVSFVKGDAKKLLCGPNIFSLIKYDPETHVCRDNVVVPITDSNSLVNGEESKIHITATRVLNGRHTKTRVPENLPKHSTTSLTTTESETLLCGDNLQNLVKYNTKTHKCENGKIVMIRSKTRVPENLPKHSTASITTTESETLLCGETLLNLVKYDTKTHKCENGKIVMIRSKTRVPENLPKHSTASITTTGSETLLCGDTLQNLVKYGTKTHKCKNGKVVMIRSKTRVPENLPKHSTTSFTTTESETLLCGDTLLNLLKYDTKTHKCENGKIVMIRSKTRVPENFPKHSISSLTTTESETLLCGDTLLSLVKYDTKTHKCENGKIVMIRSMLNPTTRMPITSLPEKSRTTRKEISENTSVGQKSIKMPCRRSDLIDCNGIMYCGNNGTYKCCGFQTFQPKQQTCCRVTSSKYKIHDDKPERNHICCGVNVYPRRKSKAPCQHSSRNDAFLSGKLPKMKKKLLESMICNENIMFGMGI
ncbi:uncharacterized protein LOC128547110 [Mercenaria mercenaria]|uniref:uncharacterized protein LOC128547110 n=1 Tax=Mercenaria mercenaria TaxID=6596 RepID=UPI00234F1406|nr:uncharacterized protein LOC128547110 [Mercenaria mercenaria]